MTAATARGGEVLELARKRVAPVLTMLAACAQQLSQACTEDDSKHAVLMARDNKSDLETGAVVWNLMGRPRQSIDYDLIGQAKHDQRTPADEQCPRATFAYTAIRLRSVDAARAGPLLA